MRRRDLDEGSQSHWKRHDIKGRCGLCQQTGHNKRSCPLNSKIKRGKDTVAKDESTTNDGGSQLQTQGSQLIFAPNKYGRPEGSKTPKTPKDPTTTKAPKAPKVPKAPKAAKEPKVPKAPIVNIPIECSDRSCLIDIVTNVVDDSKLYDIFR